MQIRVCCILGERRLCSMLIYRHGRLSGYVHSDE